MDRAEPQTRRAIRGSSYRGAVSCYGGSDRKLVAKLAAKCCQLTFCYEAGPTGYGIYRLLKSLGHDCLVVVPSLVPKKAGDREDEPARCGKPRQAVARG